MNADKFRFLINDPEKSFSSVFIRGEFLLFPVIKGSATNPNAIALFHLFPPDNCVIHFQYHAKSKYFPAFTLAAFQLRQPAHVVQSSPACNTNPHNQFTNPGPAYSHPAGHAERDTNAASLGAATI